MAILKKGDTRTEYPFTEFSIQQHLRNFFGKDSFLIIPNVMLGYCEADLIVISKAGYLHEVEIKISKQDIKKDKEKYFMAHKYLHTKYFSFAVPDFLSNCEDIPADSGLISVDKYGYCNTIRPAKISKNARKLSTEEILKYARLTQYRMWNLREKLFRRTHDQRITV